MSSDSQDELRRRFVAAVKAWRGKAESLRVGAAEARSKEQPNWALFATLTCGARTRAGTPCKQKGLYDCGRCRLHGGLSTGPRTREGKRTSALNGMRRRTP